jgi:hypothetical protein
MNKMHGKLLRDAYLIATGICLTLQAVLKRKLTFRTSTISGAPVYALAQSGNSSTQSFIFHKSYERLKRH